MYHREKITSILLYVKNLTFLFGTALLLSACGGGPAGDTTAPTVALSASQSSTTVNLAATASDDVGVTKVEFYKGSETTPFATDTTAPYTASFTVSSANNGTLNVTAKAYDAAGNQGQGGAQVAVYVAPADTTAPVVKLAADFPSTPGTATLTATVNEPVSKVEFYWNGKLAATDTTAPYSAAFDLDQRQNGSVGLVAKAYDLAGNVGSDSLTKAVYFNTVHQGDWLWMTFDASDKITAAGIATFFDQIEDATGKTATGFYGKRTIASDPKSPIVLKDAAAMGPWEAAGLLQVRLFENVKIGTYYILADDDDNRFEADPEGLIFYDDDAEIREGGTSKNFAFIMGQLSKSPTLDSMSAKDSGLSVLSISPSKEKRTSLLRQANALAVGSKQISEFSPTQTMEQLLPIFKKLQ